MVDRREFLKLTGAQAGLLMVGSAGLSKAVAASRPPGPHVGRQISDVVVVGGGAFGTWTALYLRELGASVTLVEMYGPGNSRATSGADIRQTRAAGRDELDVRWSLRSEAIWRERLSEWGRPDILVETSLVRLSGDWLPSEQAAMDLLERYGVPTEVLDRSELAYRFPQLGLDGISVALVEPAGMLKAREGCQVVARAFEEAGGRLQIDRVEVGETVGDRLVSLSLASGGQLKAGMFVFACGPWLRTMFPDWIGSTIRTTRAGSLYFGTPPGDVRYCHPNFVNYRDNTTGFYGFPSLGSDYRGFHVLGGGGDGLIVDPDFAERETPPEVLQRAREFVAQRFPGLRGQPILERRVWISDYTTTGQFLVDRHPDLHNTWIVGGGAGRGYKHSPAVGEYVAHRALGRDREPDLAPLFGIPERFDSMQAFDFRSVIHG